MPGGESTSAQLRRIAQERTQLAVALRAKTEELRQEQTARAATQADLTRVEGERDTAETWVTTLNGALIAARADLTSARQEIEQLKAGGAS